MQYLLYINLIFCNSCCHSLFLNTLHTIINQSLYFIKQQRVIKKVTTHRGVPWRFVTSWFKSQKDLIKSWINPWGKRCYIDSVDGHKAAYFFSLVSVNTLGKRNSFLQERKQDFLDGGSIIWNALHATFLLFHWEWSVSFHLPWLYVFFWCMVRLNVLHPLFPRMYPTWFQ